MCSGDTVNLNTPEGNTLQSCLSTNFGPHIMLITRSRSVPVATSGLAALGVLRAKVSKCLAKSCAMLCVIFAVQSEPE